MTVVVSQIEQYHIQSPEQMHTFAMDTWMTYRRDVDPTADFNNDSPLMKRAEAHAVKRMMLQPDSSLHIAGSPQALALGITGEVGLLPAPVDGNTALMAAISSQQSESSYALMPRQQANAMATSFSGDVGLGAISKAGVFPMGDDGAWLALVEEKRKKENSMDYHSLLWELGSEVAEKEYVERGGVNVTTENILLENMKKWFHDGGGQLHFAKAEMADNHGFRLKVTEDVSADDTVLSVPLKLIMCRQTARNIVILGKGRKTIQYYHTCILSKYTFSFLTFFFQVNISGKSYKRPLKRMRTGQWPFFCCMNISKK